MAFESIIGTRGNCEPIICAIILWIIICLMNGFPFCFFAQTVTFVAFNKVMTAQYFVWFFFLLPLILPWTNMKLRGKGLVCILVWIAAQGHWLLWGCLNLKERMSSFNFGWPVCYSWLQIFSFLSILFSNTHIVQSSNSHLVPLQRNMSNRDEESNHIPSNSMEDDFSSL